MWDFYNEFVSIGLRVYSENLHMEQRCLWKSVESLNQKLVVIIVKVGPCQWKQGKMKINKLNSRK